MAGEWRTVTVDEIKATQANALATGPFGSSIGSRFFVNCGIPVIRGSNLSDEVGLRLVDDDLVFLTPEKSADFQRSMVRAGDLIFTCWGTIGQVGLIDRRSRFREYVISNKQMKLTPDPCKADSLFLYYAFSSPDLHGAVINQAIGTSVPGFNLGQLRTLPIHLPPLPEQRAIAHVLGTLDDKIELNRRMNETLEAIARALFKSWFVDLESVSGIDAGSVRPWRKGKLSDFALVLRNGLDPGRNPTGSFDHYSIPAFDSGCVPSVDLGSSIKSGKLIVPSDAVLLSKLNPDIPRIWMPLIGTERRSVCSTEFIVLEPQATCSKEYLYALASSSLFLAEFESLVTGATNSHQRVRADDALSIPVLIPDNESIDRFTSVVAPMFKRIALNRRESLSLTVLRDTLLPKLISGELRVKDTERLIESAMNPRESTRRTR